MIRSLSAAIAWRYLRSKKSHGAVSAIAAVSVAGVAIATAAIVCVLSVFNGFQTVLSSKLNILTPDVTVTPVRGKTIPDVDSLAQAVSKVEGVDFVMPSVTDKALAIAHGREMPVTLKGVDPALYSRLTKVDSIVMVAERTGRVLTDSLPNDALVSIGAVMRLGNAHPGDSLMIFLPKREGRINVSNPVSSFVIDSIRVAGVYEAKQSEFDTDMMIVPIQTARDLFQYDDFEATALEVKGKKGVAPELLGEKIRASLDAGGVGSQYEVKDRLQQQEINFRMIRIEKWVTFLLLFFILVIASFNIISTMSMFVLEKRRSLKTLRALGMSARRIGAVFTWESLYVSLLGGVAGIVLGVALSLAQEHFGLIKIAGDPTGLIMTAYPVHLIWTDLIAAMIPILLIGVATSLIASAFARRKI